MKHGWIYDGYHCYEKDGKKYRTHRIIMEEYIGRKLSTNEVVHHKNGNKLDNRISNLEILTPKSHAIITLTKTIRTEFGKTCNKCGVMKKFSEYHKHRWHKDGLVSICKDCMVHINSKRDRRKS